VVVALMRLREALAGFDALVRQRGDASPGDHVPAACATPGSDEPVAASAGGLSGAGSGAWSPVIAGRGHQRGRWREMPPEPAVAPVAATAGFSGAEHNARLPATPPCEIPDV
jgi:hypothetical protein